MQSERTSAAGTPSYTERARKVAQVLGRDFTPRGMDRFGWTDLHYAVVIGDSALVRRLLQDGADANAHLRDGCFPSQRLIEALVGEGAGAEHWRWLTDTPLRLVTRRDDTAMADLLIAHGADVNEAGEGNHPPLIDAARYDACNVAALLIGSGARIGCRIHDDRTPLHWAAACNAVETAGCLLANGADPDSGMHPDEPAGETEHESGTPGTSPLRLADEENARDVARLLIECGAKQHMPPLHSTVWLESFDAVEALVKRGADVCRMDDLGRMPLHLAARRGDPGIVSLLLERRALDARDGGRRTPLHYATEAGGHRVAELLLNRGARADARDERRRTPLHHAAGNGALRTVALLLDRGAPVNPRDRDDNTPLHDAAGANAHQVASLLLDRGAPVNVRNRYYDMPLHRAAKRHALAAAEVLIERGADVNAPATAVDRLTPLHFAGWAGPPFDLLELLLRHGADVDAPEIDDSDTLLHYAAARDDRRLAELLIAHGASVDEMNEVRWTPLHRAAEEDAWEVADVLLRHGADVHIETNDGTALHIAAAVDGSRVAELLLARGAEATRRDRFGETPLDVAMRENADAVIALLRLHESMYGMRDVPDPEGGLR